MGKRLTDTEIWDEDWFIDLPNEYKLFFLYIKDKCDHSGMWRPNRRKFSMIVHGKTIHYAEFIEAVNKDETAGGVKKRVIVLDNGKWFITRFIPFQCGKVFNIKIGAHRGALKLLIFNNIHPSEVPDMDWRGMDSYDLQELKEIGHDNGIYRLSKEYEGSKHTLIEREIDPVKGNKGGKEGVGEKPIFKLQHLYDRGWNQVDTREREFKGIDESQFCYWKKFVDWIIGHGYEELFRAIFVTPADFTTLVNRNKFTEEKWEPVVAKMLSTGIKAEQNLYFRIPDFMKHAKVNEKGKETALNAGAADYQNQEKW